ncbi:hypothetical protein NQF87_00010 [Bombella sp. TMW 2.2559]|uniref:Stc1 domain-containing protein n=1 Tax=Bombella dulcis TaxID=2967339 RepID=A0ABT3W9A3_9PROT|nr:hypothetical protein [Bombella dulcis]MCX5615368.1 hypothetical protein [Bombella dulcis]
MNRTCRKCGAEKSLTEFCKDSRSKGGYRHTCLQCYRAERKKIYAEKAARQIPKISTTSVVNGQKICGQCLQTLPVSRFSRDRSKTCGLQWRCKGCVEKNKAARQTKNNGQSKTRKTREFPPFKGYGMSA